MFVSALLAYLPQVPETHLREVQHVGREFNLDLRPVPFSANFTKCINDGQAVIVVMSGPQSLSLFWCEPRQISQLVHVDENRLYETLAKICLDFFSWPCDKKELAARIHRLTGCRMPDEDSAPPIPEEVLEPLGLVGNSESFRRALRLIARFSLYDVPVLLEGETGTGKELFARAIHYLGSRRSSPFVPVNCGALPDTLIENELFGHAAGAYTGASGALSGVVAQAERGTLFFDEVHCLSPKGQATLLRFAQDQNYRPLGSAASRQANVRIISATNRSLCRCVAEGSFRDDLFYRLNVGHVRLPSLRERSEDIRIIVKNIVSHLTERYSTGPRWFDAMSLAWMSAQEWPGNVRELENFVHREFLLSDDVVMRVDPRRTGIPASDIAATTASALSFNQARAATLAGFESRYIQNILALTNGSVTEAARRAGKDRRVFGRLMKKYGIERQRFVA